ncbi:MAG: extracellular solute-binding protein [Spirochaetaceae bacterium]|nr:extracellular solute-binding protein [Spirochaetaceae bacterium]
MNNKIKWSITIFLVISLVLGMFACKQEADSPAPNATEEVLSLGDLVALSADSMYSQVKESLADKDAAYESLYGRSANPSVIRAGEEETTSTEPVTLKVLGYGWGQNDLDYIFDVFEETYPNVTIEKEILAGENYHNKVKAYTEENLVHVAMMGSDVRHGENWAEKQVNIKKDLEPGYYHIGSFPRGDNGEIYYVPDGAKNLCSVVVINMELLNQIGGKVPENYDDLVALAALCESEGIDCLTAFGGTAWRWGTDIFSPIVARTTGDANWVQKVAKGNAKFTDAGFVAALEAVKKYFDHGIFDQSILTFDSDTLPDQNAKLEKLTSGETLMFTCEQNDLNKYTLGEDLSNYKLLPFMPVYGEKNNMRFCVAAVDNIGWGITVATDTDSAVREAALNFIEIANTEANAAKRVDDGGITGPVVQSLYQKPIEEFGTLATQKMFILEKYKNVDVIDAYLPQEINDVLFTAVKDMVQNGKTATEAAKDVQTAYEAM